MQNGVYIRDVTIKVIHYHGDHSCPTTVSFFFQTKKKCLLHV